MNKYRKNIEKYRKIIQKKKIENFKIYYLTLYLKYE